MKKHVLFIATAAAMLAGCAKEVEKPAEEQTGKLYTITALVDNPETRTLTENDGTNKYKFSWDTGENISVVSVNPSSKLLFQVSDTENGTFTYQAGADETYGGFKMAVTPANALVDNNPTPNNFTVELSGDYLYGQSNALMIAGEPSTNGDNYKFQFKHAAALVQVTYNNVPVGTKAMVLTSANNITGTATLTSATGVSIATGNLSGTPGKVAKVSFDEALTQPMSTAVFYVPIPIGSYQSFDIKLVNNADVEIPGSAFTISAGSAVNVVVGNVLLFPAKTVVDFSGEWVLTGIKSNQTYACGKYTTGNNIQNVVAITVDAQQQRIEAVEGIVDCKITISRAANGLYVIQDMNEENNYWYAAGTGTANQLKAAALGENEDKYYWSISESNDRNHVITARSENRNTIEFNPNGSSTIFSCYAAGSQQPVTLYPYSWVRVDTTPQIIVAENEQEKSVAATATSVSFAYSTKNITGAIQAAVTSDVNHIISGNPQVGNNTITVNLVPNEDNAAKTATITLSYEGAEDVVLTINQAAAADGPITYSYLFTAKDWKATLDGQVADWTSGLEGYQFNSTRGIQVTKSASGANATSPVSYNGISNITVTLAKSSGGAGSVEIKVGNVVVATQSSFTGDATDYSFDISNLRGTVTITVTCGSNSIYVKGISITATSTGEGGEDGDEGTKVTFNVGVDSSDDTTLEKDGVTLLASDGVWNRTDNYRIYANATLTVSAPSGKNITRIEFTYDQNKFSTATGTITNAGVWSGNADSIVFSTVGGQVRVSKIVVTYK